jgi:integrase
LKNDKARLIVPAPAVIRVLKDQRQTQREWCIKAGEAWSNPEGFVFTNEIGQHLASPTVYNNFKRIVRDIGLPEARFHDLRHSYAVAAYPER